MGNEFPVQLPVDRMPIPMILDLNSIVGELSLVQVVPGGVAGQIAIGPQRATDGDQPLGLRAGDSELRAEPDVPAEGQQITDGCRSTTSAKAGAFA